MKFVIPEREVSRVASLLRVSPQTLTALGETLRSWNSSALDGFAQKIAERVAPNDLELASVVELLMSWYVVRNTYSMSAETFVDSIADAASRDSRHDLKNVAPRFAKIKDAVVGILSDESFGLISKAGYLRHEVFRPVLGSQILTDARPIFDVDSVTQPKAFVITHTLQITSQEETGQKDWHFSLDMDDIRDLKAKIDRAIEKNSALTKFILSANARVIE